MVAGTDLAQRPRQCPERGSQNGSTDHVEPASLVLILGGERRQETDHDQRQRRVDPEHRLPAEPLDQPAAQDRSAGGGQGRSRSPDADRPVTLFFGINGADQSEARWRQYSGRNTLQDTRRNEPSHRRSQRASRRRQSEEKG